MSSPIPAPNYTQIPNALIGMMPRMKEAELRVTLAIARQTFGWHRERDVISLTQLKEMTGLSRQGVINGIECGIQHGLVERRPLMQNGQATFEYCLIVSDTVEVVNEVDHLQKHGSQRSRPRGVNVLDHLPSTEVVNEVDSQKKDLKETSLKKDDTTTDGGFDPVRELVAMGYEPSQAHHLVTLNPDFTPQDIADCRRFIAEAIRLKTCRTPIGKLYKSLEQRTIPLIPTERNVYAQ